MEMTQCSWLVLLEKGGKWQKWYETHTKKGPFGFGDYINVCS